MADPKKPAAPTAPAQKPTTPPAAPPAPAAPVAEEKKPKKEKKTWQYVFPTAEAAKAEADKRDGGPRRPFEVKHGDKTTFVVAHNPEHAAAIVGYQVEKWEVQELGKAAKGKKEVGVDSILAALQSLPDADRLAVEEALKKLKG